MATPRSSLRVLVVDDDPVLSDLLASLLHVLGHAVDIANTGRLALQRLALHPPIDAVLIDLRMPDMDGVTLAAAIAELPQPPRLIGMSGGEPTVQQAVHFHSFLHKPFGVEGLARVLAEPAPDPLSSPDSASASAAVLDIAIYRRLCASMPAARLQELYRRTLDSVRQTAPALDAASAAERSELAHTLQGSCAMVGARELAGLAADLENGLPHENFVRRGSPLESPISYKILRASDRLERILKQLQAV